MFRLRTLSAPDSLSVLCVLWKKEARNHTGSGQKQPWNRSFKGSVDDFRLQATLRIFFLAFLRVPGQTRAKATLQIRVIQPTGVRPQGLWPMWGCHCGAALTAPLRCLSPVHQPHLRSPALSCVLPSARLCDLNSFINLERGCHESECV